MMCNQLLKYIGGELGPSKWAESGLTYGNTDLAKLGEMLGIAINILGGEDEVKKRLSYYQEIGDSDNAQLLLYMLAASNLTTAFADTGIDGEKGPFSFLGFG